LEETKDLKDYKWSIRKVDQKKSIRFTPVQEGIQNT
jgi:hypothetical protein